MLDSDEDEQDRLVINEAMTSRGMLTSQRRELHQKQKEDKLVEAINLNRFFTNKNNPYCIDNYLKKLDEVYIMDAKTCGNIGRYFNHSCAPNIFVQNVFVDTYDLRFPWLAFFSSVSIKAGTELCWV